MAMDSRGRSYSGNAGTFPVNVPSGGTYPGNAAPGGGTFTSQYSGPAQYPAGGTFPRNSGQYPVSSGGGGDGYNGGQVHEDEAGPQISANLDGFGRYVPVWRCVCVCVCVWRCVSTCDVCTCEFPPTCACIDLIPITSFILLSTVLVY